jgi:hypothetical protein
MLFSDLKGFVLELYVRLIDTFNISLAIQFVNQSTLVRELGGWIDANDFEAPCMRHTMAISA